jgi:hypothetical protein
LKNKFIQYVYNDKQAFLIYKTPPILLDLSEIIIKIDLEAPHKKRLKSNAAAIRIFKL